MTRQQQLLLIVVLFAINAVIALIYDIYGHLAGRQENKQKYTLITILLIGCPIVSGIVLLIGFLCYRLFFDTSIDLAAITFSKKRVDVLERPDVESEMNLIPMEEAIMIDDTESLRSLLLTVLRGDISKSVNAVTKALNSSDSEASHYAASAIMDITNDFQKNLQKFQTELEKNPQDIEIHQLYIEYLIKMLSADFLSDLELKTYVYMLKYACDTLYEVNPSGIQVLYYSSLILFLQRIEDIAEAQIWIERLILSYPDDIETYRCVLHFYYDTKDKDRFFEELNKLKHSNISIDKDLLELIRVFT